MKKERINLWKDDEYKYPFAYGFKPNMVTYLHEDNEKHPCMIVIPGGGYCFVSPTEGEIVAKKFYGLGYNAFVVTYTINMLLKEPLMNQPMKDVSRAIRLIRHDAELYGIYKDRVTICGFSAGAHLCGSVSVHYDDVKDEDSILCEVSNRPDSVILSYPVITSGEFAHRGSFDSLIGLNPNKEELEYFSLEKQVTENTPPTFLWHTMPDDLVPVENSYLYEEALRKAGVEHALHVFSFGHHGLGLGDKTWADRIFGEPYTKEQTEKTLEAVRNGEVDLPDDEKARILRDFDIDDSTPDVEYPEIQLWPNLADAFIRRLVE